LVLDRAGFRADDSWSGRPRWRTGRHGEPAWLLCSRFGAETVRGGYDVPKAKKESEKGDNVDFAEFTLFPSVGRSGGRNVRLALTGADFPTFRRRPRPRRAERSVFVRFPGWRR